MVEDNQINCVWECMDINQKYLKNPIWDPIDILKTKIEMIYGTINFEDCFKIVYVTF